MDQTRGGQVIPVRIQPRPKGIRLRDAPLPKRLDGRNLVAILTRSTYQVASHIWFDAWLEAALRIIFVSRSCVSQDGKRYSSQR